MNYFENIKSIENYQVKPEPIEFIWTGFKKNTVGLMTSPGGTGKSFLALQLGLSVANACPIFNWIPDYIFSFKHSKVLYLSAEDDEQIVHTRMYELLKLCSNEEMKRIQNHFYIQCLSGSGFNLFGQNEQYTAEHNHKCVEQLTQIAENFDLIIVDTLTKIHCADENSNGEMSALLRIFEKIAKEKECSFFILHHTNKNSMTKGETDEQSSSRGASALVDNVRYHITLSKMSKKERDEHDTNEDRSFFVKLSHSKLNYTKPIHDFWLKKHDGGVMKKADLNLKQKGSK